MNLVVALIGLLSNVMRSAPAAATAVTGAAAGAAVIVTRPPTTAADWVVIVAGAIGMVANVIQANVIASTAEDR